jgi:chemoreceptor-like protein with four helix bundle sensory module
MNRQDRGLSLLSRRWAQIVTSRRPAGVPRVVIVWIALASAVGCSGNTSLERLIEARRLAASLLIQFTKAADAANRAVMADTDETSTAFAREAGQLLEGVQKDAQTLAPLLQSLGFSSESALLEEFEKRFAEYRAIDSTILDLAVENTNLKAQRLSFTAAQKAADSLRDSLDDVARVGPPATAWEVRALVATAVAGAVEILALQAPHIAEPDDAEMTRLEQRMASAEMEGRSALKGLSGVVQPASRPQLAAATAAFDTLMEVNAQIVTLSRRNSNVRSLALSLNQKRTITASCEESLQALQDALAKRGFTATR